jgi:tetratricopeptide (TPR) repeat protein
MEKQKMRMRLLLITAAITGLAGCATARGPAEGVSRLEAEQRANPRSAPVLRALGIAYYGMDRHQDARNVLERAHALEPRDGTIALYLGMSAEELGDFAAARTAYSSYIQHGRTRRVRGQLEARLADLHRKEIAQFAQTALRQEAEISQTPGDVRTVAILPLRFSGTDSTLRPLERGIADLVITDLGRISRLTIVERDRLQALLDEMRLSESDRADPNTAIRTGRLIRAGRVVQGSIVQSPATGITLTAAVLDPQTSGILAGTPNRTDQLEQIFALQKQFTFDILDSLRIVPTPAERVAIEQRPTRSIAAFLSYSSGLLAQDNGNLDEARRLFDEAVRIDPSFGMAAQQSQQASAAIEGAEVTTATIETSLQGTPEGNVVAAASQGNALGGTGGSSLSSTLAQTSQDLVPSQASIAASGGTTGGSVAPTQDPSSTQGTDPIGSTTGTIRIVIPQPPPQEN